MTLYIYGVLFVLIDYILYKSRANVPPFFYFFGAFLIMGFQDAAGGDYLASMKVYNSIDVGIGAYRSDEFLWRFLNLTFNRLGIPFWGFILFQSLINTAIISKFASKYIADRRYWILAFAIFYFTFNYMMFHMTGMRQSFALELCLLSVILFDEKKYLHSIMVLLAGRFVHSSAIIMLIVVLFVYLMETKRFKWLLNIVSSKFAAIILIAIFVFVYINKALLSEVIVTKVLQQDMGGFENYIRELSDTSYSSDLIYLYNIILLCLSLFMMTKVVGICKIFMLLTAISSISAVIFVGAGSLFRVFLYFEIFNVVTIPLIIQYFFKINKIMGVLLIIFFIAYAFKTSMPYMVGEQEYHHYNNYHFIFQ